VWFWWDLTRLPIDRRSMARSAAILSLAVGVYLCLFSFGPTSWGRTTAHASSVLRVLMDFVPPTKSIREIDRFWLFGGILLSVYATIQLGTALRRWKLAVQAGVAAFVLAATFSLLRGRPLAPSSAIAPPVNLVDLLSHSTGKAGVYVHPEMTWNSKSGVLMMAVARQTRRPFVNGYLGIAPPWFGYAAEVLHRFPDPEATWLLRQWKIDTVLGAPGTVLRQPPGFVKVHESSSGIVWDAAPTRDDSRHPSESTSGSGETRVEASWSVVPTGHAAVIVTVPERFQASAVTLTFGHSAVQRVPATVNVYAVDGTRLNEEGSGIWIESLAADALLGRERPVATVRLREPYGMSLLLDFNMRNQPPLERVVLAGRTF
jgi:hypothetical protein